MWPGACWFCRNLHIALRPPKAKYQGPIQCPRPLLLTRQASIDILWGCKDHRGWDLGGLCGLEACGGVCQEYDSIRAAEITFLRLRRNRKPIWAATLEWFQMVGDAVQNSLHQPWARLLDIERLSPNDWGIAGFFCVQFFHLDHVVCLFMNDTELKKENRASLIHVVYLCMFVHRNSWCLGILCLLESQEQKTKEDATTKDDKKRPSRGHSLCKLTSCVPWGSHWVVKVVQLKLIRMQRSMKGSSAVMAGFVKCFAQSVFCRISIPCCHEDLLQEGAENILSIRKAGYVLFVWSSWGVRAQ